MFIEKEWENLRIKGRSDFVLKEKLKLLKISLRRWDLEVFGRVNLLVDDNVSEINIVYNLLSYCNGAQVKEPMCVRS